MLSHALELAKRGLKVVPCHVPQADGSCSCRGGASCQHVGKHPRIPDYLNAASKEPEVIQSWWGRWPDANIGLACRPSGILVVDIDPRNGGDRYDLPGPVPDTAEVLSGGGGCHIYLEDTDNNEWPGELSPGIELKSNCIVLAPPSLHPSGKRYIWDGIRGIDNLDSLAPVPEWLQAFRKDKAHRSRPNGAADVDVIPEGQRNATLFRRGCAMRRQGFSREEIRHALLALNSRCCRPPLSAEEVDQIADSAARYQPSPDDARQTADPESDSDQSRSGEHRESNEPPREESPDPGKPSDGAGDGEGAAGSNAAGTGQGGGDWPDPRPLDTPLPPVPDFDPAVLPEVLRIPAAGIAHRWQVPLDLPAIALIAAAAGAINNRIRIQPKRNDTQWIVRPNLWGLIIGPPGTMKSPILKAATEPLRVIEAKWRKEYEAEMATFASEEAEYKLRFAAWQKNGETMARKGNPVPACPEKPQKPVERRLIIVDATWESLFKTLSENPNGLLVVRDEASSWLAQLERKAMKASADTT